MIVFRKHVRPAYTPDLFGDDEQCQPIAGFFGPHRFLSNFFDAKVTLEGDTYPSVENAYQAAKTKRHLRSAFQICSAGQAKTMGRSVVVRKDWDAIKVDVMRDLLMQKFAPGTEMAKKLLETNPRELIEDNTWGDTFWGRCKGRGQNNLGRLLMQCRELLMMEKSISSSRKISPV